ncbi:MAG: hypothetical protein JWN88_1625 [Frankiales bacterium]|jgi:hypothetical protein|nr:hypothetical protein [Frankiales bacterium]
MRINLKSKKVLAGGVAAITVLSGGAAYAYWTAGGSGAGTAATAAATTPLTVNQSTAVTPMYPGLAAQTLSGTFGNTNSGPIYVTSVTASIASVTKADQPVVGCAAADYTLAGATMAVGTEVPAGAAMGAWTGATIQFKNTVANQDACKGATVNLSYVVA